MYIDTENEENASKPLNLQINKIVSAELDMLNFIKRTLLAQ